MDKNTVIDLEIRGFAREVMEFIDDSPSIYHVVKNVCSILEESGYKKIDLKEKWDIDRGGKYYITKTDSTVLAFDIPQFFRAENGFKIFASHLDSPSIRIKPNPEIVSQSFVRLNTEIYSGPILSTWMDRPLSIAGRVIVKGENTFEPLSCFIKLDKIKLVIPNLAIHFNREVNSGYNFDKQNDMLPIISTVTENFEKDNYLLKLIAKELKISIEDILDFDLMLYPVEKGNLVGANKDMLSSTKLDNLISVYTGLIGILESEREASKINVFVAFDNEEIGSSTKQGADSNYLSSILERIIYSFGYSRSDYLHSLANSFMLSADGGHLAHPSHLSKTDIINSCEINKGVAIKLSVNQRYTSDGKSMAVIKQIAKNNNIKLQMFVNNSNIVGGSTIGPLSARHLDIDSVDLGVPMLAMHSIRELCGVYDVYYLKELAREYFDA